MTTTQIKSNQIKENLCPAKLSKMYPPLMKKNTKLTSKRNIRINTKTMRTRSKMTTKRRMSMKMR